MFGHWQRRENHPFPWIVLTPVAAAAIVAAVTWTGLYFGLVNEDMTISF